MKIIVETERLLVREFTADDYENYFVLHSDPKVMQYIRPAEDRAGCDKRFEDTILHLPPHAYMGRWAVNEKESGRFVGCFVITPIPNQPERIQLGYSFIPELWGRGYATEVSTAGVAYFHDRTPLTELYAVTETANTASEKVLRKVGFEFLEKKMEGEKELLVFIIRK
jgi:[ribosomal protein S5]-alanine N-acetyltransferase